MVPDRATTYRDEVLTAARVRFVNAPDQRDPGEEPEFDDTFDHFFKGPSTPDPDETRPISAPPPATGPDAATQSWDAHAGYAAAPAEPAPRESRRGGVILPLLVIFASVAIVAVVVYFALGGGGRGSTQTDGVPEGAATGPTSTQSDTPSGSSNPSGSSSDSSSSSSSPSSSSSSSSSSTSSSSASAPLPDGATNCHSTAYSVGPKTSCGFGASVAAAASSADFSSGSATLTDVYSPTTHEKYTLTCTQGGYLTCVTESGAVVYVKNP